MGTGNSIARACMLGVCLLAGCASSGKPPQLPYPAFVVSDDLPDVYIAALPGVRAKQYAWDMRTRATSNRIELPPGWSGTTGGAPGMSLEIFVVSGKLRLSDFELSTGGYAFVPPGSLGFALATDQGARVLYFLADDDSASVIRSPLILDSGLLDWQQLSPGIYTKELRNDPGSGSKTWLQRIDPGAASSWQSSSSIREGYLLRGEYQHSECLEGEAQTWQYLPGGYFRRPADIVNGGPESFAIQSSVWFFREPRRGRSVVAAGCGADAAEP